MTRLSACLTALALAALAAPPAAAQEVVYGPDGAPTVVQKKLYPMRGRTELSLLGSASLNTALVDQFGAVLAASYHPNEWLDVGVDLTYNYTQLSGLTEQVRLRLPARYDTNANRANKGDEVGNNAQLRWGALAMAKVAPIYGKLNLASELRVHFQAYFMVGAGAMGMRFESVNLCGVSGRNACPADQFATSDSVRLAGQLGVGLRFYLDRSWSLQAQLRTTLFPATVREGADLAQAGTGTEATYLGLVNTLLFGVAGML